MINSTFDPQTVNQFEKSKMGFNGQKIKATIPAGTTLDIDLVLTDDHLLTGAIIELQDNSPDDEIKMQIVHPSFGVVNQFIDWYARDFNKELTYPAKLAAGLTIIIKYKSTGSTDVVLHSNLSLHKVLV